ncbi:GD25250 [Drosophila simulans]|uniref:GD25250 n=1 Tax=Drosophila simulans TaxID=7240 RepID=B4QF56_DROSI|nr:GD25250 [Drosophila simulans]
MSFQRSYSKVWWGSEQSSLTSGGFYSSFSGGSSTSNYPQRQPASLGPLGNLSCIQEVEDEQNSSKLSWHKHDSPGSLRSQDASAHIRHLHLTAASDRDLERAPGAVASAGLLRQSLALKPANPQQHLDSSYGGDISQWRDNCSEQQLLQATPAPGGSFSSGHQTPEAQTQTNSSGMSSSGSRTKAKSSASPLLKFNLTRQESFV